PRRRAEWIGDAGLLDGRVPLAHDEDQRADAAVLARHETDHPVVARARLERRREVAVDVPEPGEEGDGGRRLERLAERGLQHLLLLGLVDPYRPPVAPEGLPV